LPEFLVHRVTTNADRYDTTLHHMKEAIRSKQGKVTLLHDNAPPPNTTRGTIQLLEHFRWECPTHLPHLASRSFHLSGPLKMHFEGKRFRRDVQLKADVYRWLHSVPISGIECTNRCSDYMEKRKACPLFPVILDIYVEVTDNVCKERFVSGSHARRMFSFRSMQHANRTGL
jgi:hypothetical protein